MKKRLFGGLIVAGALTLWSSVGVLADDAEGLEGPGAAPAAAAIASLATNSDCNPDLGALAALAASSKDPQKAQQLVNGLKEQIAQVKESTKEQILTALEQYQELFRERRDGDHEDGAARTMPQLPDFMTIVNTNCSQVPSLVTATAAAIQALPAPTVTRDGERDDEGDSERETQTTTRSHERD